MATNVLTQVRLALWSALDGSSALQTFIAGGRVFKLGAGGYLPTRVTKDDCPALAVLPAQAEAERFGESLEELRYRLRVVGWLYTDDAAKAEEFLLLIHDAVVAEAPDLGLDAVKGVAVGPLAFSPHFDQSAGRYWEVSVTVEAVIQR
jgi:hypothetical protein